MAGVVSRGSALTGKLVAVCRYWTHTLTQVCMRQCTERTPHSRRRWRLVDSLVEDGLLEAESEEAVAVTESEGELSESEEEDLSFLDESEPEELRTESSQSESEEEADWYGFIEA